jgi:hypothetical protein
MNVYALRWVEHHSFNPVYGLAHAPAVIGGFILRLSRPTTQLSTLKFVWSALHDMYMCVHGWARERCHPYVLANWYRLVQHVTMCAGAA